MVCFVGASEKSTIAPMFGGTPSRNMVNLIDKNIPNDWNFEEGKRKNIKWVADLGKYTYIGPTIADGKVFIATDNGNPRDPKIKDTDKGVLMAFNEADGKFLWQRVHDQAGVSADTLYGIVFPPTVEGKRLYYITPGCVVVCADTDGKIQWSLDLMKELKVYPRVCAASSPLIVGDLVMVTSGNGCDDEGKVPFPKAPSFVAINKKTGKLAWQSNLPGDKIIEGTWTNPTLAVVNGKPQVIFPGGDAVLYSFEPDTGKLIWQCDCNPTRAKKGGVNYFVGTPVVVGDKLYVGLGAAPDAPKPNRVSYFVCLDITKHGDVSPKSYDAKAAVNKGSALVWAFGGEVDPPKGRTTNLGPTMSTAAIHDGLIYLPESTGYLHCLDAKTGAHYWDHDFKTGIWGSAYYVDGKVYLGTDDREVTIFAPGKEKKLLATIELDGPIHSSPVVAGGVLYIATTSKLYAISANGK